MARPGARSIGTPRKFRWLFDIKKRIAGVVGFDVFSITQQGIKVKDLESNDGQVSMDYSKYQFVEVGDFAMNHMDLLTGGVDIASARGVTKSRLSCCCNSGIIQFVASDSYCVCFKCVIGIRLFMATAKEVLNWGAGGCLPENFKDFPFSASTEVRAKPTSPHFQYREAVKLMQLVAEQERLVMLLDEKLKALAFVCYDSPETKQVRVGSVAQIISRPVSAKRRRGIHTHWRFTTEAEGVPTKKRTNRMKWVTLIFFGSRKATLSSADSSRGKVQLRWHPKKTMAVLFHTGIQCSVVLPGLTLTEYLLALLMTPHGNFLLNENSRGAAGRNRPLNITTFSKKDPLPNLEVQQRVAEAFHCRKQLMIEISRRVRLFLTTPL